MSISSKIREQLLSSFRAELTEHIQTMTEGLLALEQGPAGAKRRQSTLADIFRAAHSLKGAARAVGVTAIEQLAHALESVLDAVRQGAVELCPDVFSACYRALDAIQEVRAAYENGTTTPPPAVLQALSDLSSFQSGEPGQSGTQGDAAPPPAARLAVQDGISGDLSIGAGGAVSSDGGVEETVRVSVAKLDALMEQVSDLLTAKIRAEQRLESLRELQEYAALWQKEWVSMRGAYTRAVRQDFQGVLRRPEPVESRGGGGAERVMGQDVIRLLDYLATSQERLRAVNVRLGGLLRESASDVTHLALATDELEEEVKRVRMLPLNTITGTFGRMVRDLAREAEKEAVLEIVGGETELDRLVLEQIKDPLTHLLRNAVDHGIEKPAQRAALGKPTAGKIALTAEQLGKDVLICVSDDGAGLDLDAIRESLVRQGRSDARSLSPAQLCDAIFDLGVSTTRVAGGISGRGVGLDVVRRNVEALSGSVQVDWESGKGATFTLTLPLRLTGGRGLLVSVSDQVFAIPLNAIERVVPVGQEEILSLEGHEAIQYDGRPVALVCLGDALRLSRSTALQEGGRTPVVVLRAAERRVAFIVDGLVGEQELVVRGLGRPLARVTGVAGATIMGSGEVVLVLNASDLIRLSLRGRHHPALATAEEESPQAARVRRRILVVDDSITTRTLEKNILEARGYSVELAVDGVEALSVITEAGMPDLIISDILMPRMDGFQLTRRLKGDERTAQVPVILVTSLGSLEDKTRGIEAGADAYIAKSSFDQNDLLEAIEQLI
jgi:two-component system chemotaxis sensor kinase CheA